MKPEFTTVPFGQYGIRTYNSGEFINPTGVRESVSNAPVYNLISTSDRIPVKSDNILHPDRIKFEDGEWKLLPLNLKDPSLYKVLFPITSTGLIGGAAISDNNE